MERKWLVGVALFALAGTLQAQEMVHAVAGVVTSVEPTQKSITLKTSDGSYDNFQFQKNLRADVDFDKALRSGTVQPSQFKKVGDHVVLYYFGEGSQATAIAIKDFGATPLSVVSGNVVKDRRHDLVIKTDKGAVENFDIAKDASAETAVGVVSGLRFDAEDGQHVTIRYTQANGTNVAQFIRAD